MVNLKIQFLSILRLAVLYSDSEESRESFTRSDLNFTRRIPETKLTERCKSTRRMLERKLWIFRVSFLSFTIPTSKTWQLQSWNNDKNLWILLFYSALLIFEKFSKTNIFPLFKCNFMNCKFYQQLKIFQIRLSGSFHFFFICIYIIKFFLNKHKMQWTK